MSKKTEVITIYHNSRCTKSRETLALITKENVKPQIVEYLKVVPTEKELSELIKKLGITADQLVRKSEKVFKEQFKGKTLNNKEWVKAMIKYPKLIQRPIVVKGDKAILGRPPENVLDLLK